MASFTYKVLDKDGNINSGTIEKNSAEEAKVELVKSGNKIITLQRQTFNFSKRSKKITKKDTAFLFKQLSYLIKTGLSLYKALELLREQFKNDQLKKIVKRISVEITNGRSLSESMALYPDIFNDSIIYQIKASEEGGYLDETLLSLSVDLEKEAEFSKSVIKAMIYPAFLLIAALGAVVFMLLYLIPSMESIFAEIGGELPGLTQFLINVSNVFQANFLYIVSAIILGVLGIKYYLKSEENKKKYDLFLLKVPIIKDLILLYNLKNITKVMSSLLESGIPINDVFTNVEKIVSNRVINEELKKAKDKIINLGYSLSVAFGSGEYFPNLMVQIIMIGEESGRLSEVMKNYSENVEREFNDKMNSVKNSITPVMTIIIGLIVGTVVISLFLPMFSMLDQF